MIQNHRTLAVLAAGIFVSGLAASNSQAQSVDSLLDKLVDKGILTTSEAKDLRKQADEDFTRAYKSKSGMPEWVTSFKINGDFRGRFEQFQAEDDDFVQRNRWRYRLRLGAVATIQDNFEVGLRLTSSESTGSFGGDPISGNTSLQDNGSKKFIYIDQAYGKWGFLKSRDVNASLTIGKMENPFVFSEMVYDPDYTPEGLGLNATYRLSDEHQLKFNGGAFILDELGGDSHDPYTLGAQLRWDGAYGKHLASSLGGAVLTIVNQQSLTNGAVGNVNRGNTRLAGTGALANEFTPVVADASLTYTFEDVSFYPGKFPIKLAGEYMNNLEISDRNQAFAAGFTIGKAGKKRTWEASYRYKMLEGDAWYEELVDSDFGAYYGGTLPNSGLGAGYGAGTNLRGHIFKLGYSPYDALTLSATYFRVEAIDEVPTGENSKMGRLQIDAILKF
ncbi:MAG: hypothetical protein RJA22_1839 [Verrucomicrobiota bacterium]|jgi:hypothetical protein